jgi:uncharacterized protein
MDLRPSQFNAFCTSMFDEVTLAYNALSGELLALDASGFAQLQRVVDAVAAGDVVSKADQGARDELCRRGFLVSRDFDERAEVRRRYHEGRERTAGLSLTIAPTVACNFGCSYCFQEHPNRRMGEAEIVAIQRYIERELTSGTSLGVVWFGGEPLLAFPVIRRLAPWMEDLCTERGSTFSQTVITNGWLLDDEKVAFLSDMRSMRTIQVTLDGPAGAHDQRRTTKGGGPTFARVLDNVSRAADRLSIAIRVNVDRTNCGHLEALVSELEQRGLRGKVSVYLGHTTPYTDVCAGVARTALTREEFADVEAGFRFHLFQRGWRTGASVPRPGSGGLCVADHPGGQVLAPGGLTFRCWNEVAMDADAASGTLDDDGAIVAGSPAMIRNKSAWDGYDPFAHEPCQTCPVQPLCRGGCPWESKKQPTFNPGHCTPLRWNLSDVLRLAHLEQAVRAGMTDRMHAPAATCP